MPPLLLWAVFMVGPGTMFPVHHREPVLWRTEEACLKEKQELLDSDRIVINDPDYELKCIPIPDFIGEPA